METKQYRIFGKVQGVWFRASTQKKAKELGVNGWVRNETDGSVTAVAQGDPDNLKEFRAWCEEGPSRARVERIEEESVDNAGRFHSFEIKY